MNLHYLAARIGFTAYFGTYHRWRVYHRERVPREGGFILASNHASFFDPPLIGTACPRDISYLARESLFRLPVVGQVLRDVNAIPVDRDGGGGAGLKAILNRLQAGGGIILFPEGTRTRDGRLQPARSGIGLTVIKSHTPVLPVRVFGSFESLDRTMRLPRPHQIVVKFGQPLNFAALRAEAQVCAKPRLKAIYQQVADEIMTAIARLEPCADKDHFP
jgi:1-acyl-sn-glycerol-3-phosphate acyltransferase